MVLGSRIDGGVPVIPVRERKTVQALKEVVRNHSDAEIYAMLKDSNMDPDETAQRLLNQDPFHEVRRRKDKRKENAGARIPSEPWKQLESNHLQSYRNNVHVPAERNTRRVFYPRSQLAGGSHEFRVVRDNRVNNGNDEAKRSISNISVADDNHMARSSSDKRLPELLSTSKLHTARGSDHKSQPVGTNRTSAVDAQAKSALPVGPRRNMSELEKSTLSNPTVQPPNETTRITEMLPSPASSSSAIGVYSSSSDPVHVPSPVPRSVGTVGASRREVGVVGKRSASQSSIPNGVSAPAAGKDVSAPSSSHSQTATVSKSTQPSQTSCSDHTIPVLVGRSFSNNKQMQQQSVGHQKASATNMEWKPKQNQKASRSDATGASSAVSISGSGLAHGDDAINPEVEVACLADKLMEANIDEKEHVIIPSHLRIPETERAHVTFGSFGKERADIPASESPESVTPCPDEPVHVTLPEDNIDIADSRTATSSLDSPQPDVADAGAMAPEDAESLNSQHIESYADIGLVHEQNPQHPIETHQIQQESDLSTMPAYSLTQNYDAPFFRPASADNSGIQELSSSSETHTAYVTNSSPSALASAMSHHQPSAQQQPTQLYPHVQFSHFPNFLPYRQFMPPMYVPQIAVPNYPSSPAYPHPSNGSSYLLMPGANSHINANGLKYKPTPLANPTAYGPFTNPAGYTISSPGAILGGASSLDDISRIKYKDSNLYVPNVQAESASELWVQTPRDLPGVQSSHYFNIAGQASHATYLPTHAAHASFNAAVQPSHMQFPGLFHPPQQTAMPNTHHLVHQQVPPSMGGNIAVGMASPTAPIASFQQAQLGHNWPGNF